MRSRSKSAARIDAQARLLDALGIGQLADLPADVERLLSTLDPAGVLDLIADSLKSISVPFVVDTAQFDESLEAVANSTNLARQIAGAREVVRPIGHFAYVLECRWLVGPILTKVAGLPICDDPDGVDRALVHKQVASDIVAFFDKTLAKAD
jgi:hypothetical protein